MPRKIILENLICAGVYVAIEQGYLVLKSSDDISPDLTLDKCKKDALVTEILRLMKIKGYKFQFHSTAKFGGGRYPGVQLQFLELNKDEDAFAIFSANLNRVRSVKGKGKGTALPKGSFSVGNRSKFAKFWRRAGLTQPKSNSSYKDYMGKLKKIIFTAEIQDGEKLLKDSLEPLEVTYQDIIYAFEQVTNLSKLSDELSSSSNNPINYEQSSDNSRIRSSDKHFSTGQS